MLVFERHSGVPAIQPQPVVDVLEKSRRSSSPAARNGIKDVGLCRNSYQFGVGTVTAHTEPVEGNGKTTLWSADMTRNEMVEASLRIGIPLHRVEEYFDWVDMQRQN